MNLITKSCYLCGSPLSNVNASNEHIIPNALGGKLKSKILLCETCNSKLGSKIDSELSKALLFFSNQLNHSRDKGKNQKLKIKINGHNALRTAEGHIYAKSIKPEKKENSLIYHIEIISSKDDIENKTFSEIQKTIKKPAKKFLWNNKKIQETEAFCKDYISKNVQTNNQSDCIVSLDKIGGKNFFWAIIKIAINFYVYKNKNIANVQKIIDSLKKQENDFVFYANHYPKSITPDDSIYHLIFLKADQNKRILYSLISLYSTINVFILLNNNYEGESFEEYYLYDIRNEKEKEFNKDISITEETSYLLGDYIYKENTLGIALEKGLSAFLEFFIPPDEAFLNDIMLDALNEVCAKSNIYDENNFRDEYINVLNEKSEKIRGGKFLTDKEKETLVDDYNIYEFYLNKKNHHILSKITSEVFVYTLRENVTNIKTIRKEDFKNLVINNIRNHTTNNKKIDDLIIRFCNEKQKINDLLDILLLYTI